MDEVETDTAPDVDGDTGTDDVVSNGDLANRRRRQQVRQACQQCRRRKIKCDEVRPVCRPCVKARLACAYELPPGQTRAQAMIESQQRLRDELQSHTSLIHALRVSDANSSIQMLGRLRHGDYDTALLGTDVAARLHSPGSRMYPWEENVDDGQRQRPRDAEMLPPIDSLPPSRHTSGLHHPPPQPAHPTPGRHDMPYDRFPPPTQPFSSGYTSSQSMTGSTFGSHGMPVYDSRSQIFPRPDLQFQSRNNPSYQQSENSHPSTLPSNDPNNNYQRPQ